MNQQAPPLFPDQDWVRKPADPDKPIWIVFHTNVGLHERSNFFLMELRKATDLPSVDEYYKKQNCTFLGSFDTESEAAAFKDFCILERSKQYTPYIDQALELNSNRSFLARISNHDLVPYASWILITANDYKLLQQIVLIQPAKLDDLESITDAWTMIVVSNIEHFKSLKLQYVHFMQWTDAVPQDEFPSLMTLLSRTINCWKWLCLHCKKIAAGDERYRRNANSVVQFAQFDSSFMERVIQFYQDNPATTSMPMYPEMTIRGREIVYC